MKPVPIDHAISSEEASSQNQNSVLQAQAFFENQVYEKQEAEISNQN